MHSDGGVISHIIWLYLTALTVNWGKKQNLGAKLDLANRNILQLHFIVLFGFSYEITSSMEDQWKDTKNITIMVWFSLCKYQDLMLRFNLETWQHILRWGLQTVAPLLHHSGSNTSQVNIVFYNKLWFRRHNT